MKTIFCLLLAAATSCAVLAQGRASIGYQNVADALAGLKARKDVVISTRDGWTIVEDQARNITWSFVPAGHPAYPALIKRAAVVRDGKAGIATTQLCQAGKSACDNLSAEFEHLNQDLRAKTYTAQGVPVSEIAVEPLGEDAYRLMLTSFTSKSASAGQQELMPKAKQLCGGKAANFGKYQFNLHQSFKDGGKDQGHLSLTQELTCGEAVALP